MAIEEQILAKYIELKRARNRPQKQNQTKEMEEEKGWRKRKTNTYLLVLGILWMDQSRQKQITHGPVQEN